MSLSKKDLIFIESIKSQYKKSKTIRRKMILAKKIARHYESTYDNIRTISIKISVTKKTMKNLYPNDNRFWDNIAPNKNITKRVIELNKEKLLSTKITKVKKSFVDKILKTDGDFATDDLLLYLLIASGRRYNEIILGKFTKSKRKNYLNFSGLLKKRGNEKSAEIFILGSKEVFLRNYNLFKKRLAKVKKLDNFQRNFARNLKDLVLPYKFTTHFLRVIYANYMFQYNNPENLIYNPFIRKVLNHKSLMSSINYSSIMLTE